MSLSGFNDLSNMLDNVLKQANSFDGKLIISIENIRNNLDTFNKEFDTNFSDNTSEEDYRKYFQEEYINLMQEHLTDNIDYKAHFNDVFVNYAHIE